MILITETGNIKKQIPSIKTMLILFALLLSGTIMYQAAIHLRPDTEPDRIVTIYTANGFLSIKTNKTMAADILEAANVTLDAKYERTIPALDQELESDHIVINKAAEIVIRVDGQVLSIVSWAGTIEDLLEEQNISIDGDMLNFSLEENIKTGQIIEIVRVERELVHEEIAIAAKTIYKNDSSVALGGQMVQTQAQDGKKKVTHEVIYHDGIEVSRSIISEEVVVEPVVGIILRGAQTVGEASWYGPGFHGNTTFYGDTFDMYAFTAAHNTLPFRSKVKVTYLKTGKSVVVEITDTGPHVAGRIIDLSRAAAEEIGLLSDGVGEVKIEFLY